MRFAKAVKFKIGLRQRKLMRKVCAQILLTTVMMGAAISISHAATDEGGSNSTVTPPGATSDTLPPEPSAASDALPPEPGTISDTKAEAAGDSSQDAATKRLKAEIEAKAAKEKLATSKNKAVVHTTEFWGPYFGAKFGLIDSSVSGTINIPGATTLSYGVQGGYLQAGYNWELSALIVGLGAYLDWNNNALHSNDISYSSSAYGLDIKLGVPVDYWLPYIKLGYGYNTGNKNDGLRVVSQNSPNIAIGVEYNIADRWSLIAEYKINKFSNQDNSVTVHNKLLTFGFNYYFGHPLKEKAKAAEIDLTIPEPIVAPDAIPEDAPPP
jgi:opacity protein-like surface antigen